MSLHDPFGNPLPAIFVCIALMWLCGLATA